MIERWMCVDLDIQFLTPIECSELRLYDVFNEMKQNGKLIPIKYA